MESANGKVEECCGEWQKEDANRNGCVIEKVGKSNESEIVKIVRE